MASPTAFHIAAQPLALALESYSMLSRRQVIYNGTLAIGRQSVAVDGVFTPEAALRLLLDGSGLAPRYMAEDAFVLIPAPDQGVPAAAAPTRVSERYYGLIQARLLQMLCMDYRTMPGSYRLGLSFWIGGDGRLAHAVLLDSTGARDRDAALAQMLRRFSVGAPPPAAFAQPVTLVIAPQPGAASECDTVHAGPLAGQLPGQLP